MNDRDGTEDTIVAIKPCCNRVVFAAVNLPHVVDAEMRREIGLLAAQGCSIEHRTVAEVRKSKWGCDCHKLK